MKIKLTCILLISLLISCNSKPNDNSENIEEVSKKSISVDFDKNYIGTINGKLNVVFHLINKNGKISGSYFYENKGVDINLVGELSDDKLIVYEVDYQNNKVSQIIGYLKGLDLNGEWKNLKSNKSFNIALKEIDKEIPPLPKNIEGIYKSEKIDENQEEACNLVIKINKRNGEYLYNFKSDERTLNGKVSFVRSIEENGVYIVFEGIEWAENEGDISNDLDNSADEKHEELELPVGVEEGSFSENEIDIQNYGNAMNSYLKLADCGAKFIHLKKQ